MDCEYWKDIVQQLHVESRCNWASHVLSTEFVFKNSLTESKLSENELMETNLGLALKCVSQEEIIEGIIYAYRDWSAQPYCDLILAQFETTKILSVYHSIKSLDSNIKLGVERFLEIIKEESINPVA
jgi:hypothetical protein